MYFEKVNTIIRDEVEKNMPENQGGDCGYRTYPVDISTFTIQKKVFEYP